MLFCLFVLSSDDLELQRALALSMQEEPAAVDVNKKPIAIVEESEGKSNKY